MKSILRLLTFVCLLYMAITSCQKEINRKGEEVATLTSNSSTANCKPIGLGLATREKNGSTSWKNLLLKWYDNNGQLSHVKLQMGYDGGTSQQNEISIEYGEVTRDNDELRIRDVFYNQEVLRVKLDHMGRPLISWFNSFGRGAPTYQYDTTYYYYSVENRLSRIVRHAKTAFGLTVIENWNFSYDPIGNLVTIKPDDGYGGLEFRYDYTQLNHGMLTLHMLSGPIKALEYLDLLRFNHHHRVTGVIWYASSGYPFWGWGYGNIQINGRGQVVSYTRNNSDPVQTYTWHTAWSCEENTMIQSKNPTQSEFMKLIK